VSFLKCLDCLERRNWKLSFGIYLYFGACISVFGIIFWRAGKPLYGNTPKWHSFFLDQTGRSWPAAEI
jgi:hypothetical protein